MERGPYFSAHDYCGQTAGWIRIPPGTEVGLGPGDLVLGGDPAPRSHEKGHSSPHFSARAYRGQAAGWIRIPLGTEVDLGPGDIVLDGDPAPPPTERGTAAPTFRLMFIVGKRLDESGYHLVRR